MIADALRESYALIAPRADRFAEEFFDRLQKREPRFAALFATVDAADVRRRFIQGLALIVRLQDHPECLNRYFAALGELHRARQIPDQVFAVLPDELLASMSASVGAEWRDSHTYAWATALANAARATASAERDDASSEIAGGEASHVEIGIEDEPPLLIPFEDSAVLDFDDLSTSDGDADDNDAPEIVESGAHENAGAETLLAGGVHWDDGLEWFDVDAEVDDSAVDDALPHNSSIVEKPDDDPVAVGVLRVVDVGGPVGGPERASAETVAPDPVAEAAARTLNDSRIQPLCALVSGIATAVETQIGVVNDLARCLENAADLAADSAHELAQRAAALEHNGDDVREVRTASSNLANKSERLREAIAKATQKQRAA